MKLSKANISKLLKGKLQRTRKLRKSKRYNLQKSNSKVHQRTANKRPLNLRLKTLKMLRGGAQKKNGELVDKRENTSKTQKQNKKAIKITKNNTKKDSPKDERTLLILHWKLNFLRLMIQKVQINF